ncbi:MAG: 3'(2'),5'-bisphosphate nucleotidase [Euryarchaeota archaeon]|nr:3'(2'),5'-bisphosphate nucleotidase [Euryarchaeota archaeon]
MPADLEETVRIAVDAGLEIMNVYRSSEGPSVQSKDDASPLTQADLAAHDTIVAGLRLADPGTPIVSEEGREGDPFSHDLAWLVDPLDGTKEFIKRNGMFTVNIALMRREGKRWSPVFGVVHAPVSGTTWLGGTDHPAERITDSERTRISVNEETGPRVRLVASGSHRTDRDEAFASELGPHDLVRMGSSLKACVVAEGSADLYPRFGPTSCWDIAAAHAVVESAGGYVLGPDCRVLDYDLVADVLNPYFLVASSTRWNDTWTKNQG